MDIPPFSQSAFASCADWKTRTMSTLDSVDKFTANKVVRDAASKLKMALLELESNQNYVLVEECIPPHLDPDLLLDCLRGLLRTKDGVARLKTPKRVEVELAVAKTEESAAAEAIEIIKTGFRIAEFIASGKPFCEFNKLSELEPK